MLVFAWRQNIHAVFCLTHTETCGAHVIAQYAQYACEQPSTPHAYVPIACPYSRRAVLTDVDTDHQKVKKQYLEYLVQYR